MAEVNPETRDDYAGPDVRNIFNAVVRRWPVMVLCALPVAILTFGYMATRPPTYTATAVVMVNPARERVLEQGELTPEIQPNTGLIETQLEILRSPVLRARVVDRLKLVEDPEFNYALRKPSFIGGLLQPSSRGAGTDPAARGLQRDVIIQSIAGAFAIRRRAPSYAIEIKATALNAERAAQLANALAQLYLESQLESRYQSVERANEWLGGRLEELRKDVQVKEAEVETYRESQGLQIAEGSSLTERQTAELQAKVLEARTDLVEREARLRQVEELVKSGGSVDAIAGVMNSGVIRDLRAKEAEIARRQADLEERYGELHPSVRNVRAERDDLAVQITAEIERIRANLINEVDVGRRRLAVLQSNLNSTRGELDVNNSALVKLRELERNAAATRAVYENFLRRFTEVTDQGSLGVPNAQIISRASRPLAPSGPKNRISVLFALAAGLATALLALLLLELFDDGMWSVEDVEERLGVVGLASIPMLVASDYNAVSSDKRHPAGYVIEKPVSLYAESLRMIRSAVQLAGLDRQVRVVAITSALANEGKTTTSLSLARVSALSGHKVAIVDCDLRRRTINNVLGIAPDIGIVEVLTGQATLDAIRWDDPESGAHLYPLSTAKYRPLDLMGSDAMARLLASLRAQYELVILDSAPVLLVAEVASLVRMSDGVVVISRAEKTPARAVRLAVQQLKRAGADVLGVALNCVRPRRFSIGHYRDPHYRYRDSDYYM